MNANNEKGKKTTTWFENFPTKSSSVMARNRANGQNVGNDVGGEVVEEGIGGIGIGRRKKICGDDLIDVDGELRKKGGITLFGKNYGKS
jgi:hypothetical protein